MQAETGASLSTATETTTTSGVARPTRYVPILLGTALAAYGTDLLTKEWAIRSLRVGEPRDLVGGMLRLHLTFNPGAAFSFATGHTWVLTIVSTLIALAILAVSRRLGSLGWTLALGLLLGGAMGNLTDRWTRAPSPGQGHVVDFLELPHWPIFNVADVAVVAGALLLMVMALRGEQLSGGRAGADD